MEEKLFYRDPSGLLHEIKTTNGSVNPSDMNAAIREYKERHGAGKGIPVQDIITAKVKIHENH